MSSGTQGASPAPEDPESIPNVRDLPPPGRDRKLGPQDSIEVLQERVDMLEGAIIVGKNLVERRRQGIWEHAQINNAKLEQIPQERKRIDQLANAVTIGVGIFAVWEFVTTSISVVGFIRRRLQEAKENKVGLKKSGDGEAARLNARERLHARQWPPK